MQRDPPEDNPYVTDPDLTFRDVADLDADAAREEVALLREAIEYHDYRYYVESAPVVSDRAYDRLFDRLQTLEDVFDLRSDTSPTQRVGGDTLDELETVDHVTEMLSLRSASDEAAVRDFDDAVRAAAGDVRYSAEPKFDGISIELVYEGGEFVRAVTRGNGVEGEDVTANVRTIRAVPLRLAGDPPDALAVRGEIYMSRSGFQDLNEERVREGKDPFANPRNAAAGTVRLLDPSAVADRPLSVFCYDVMDTSADLDSQADAVALLEAVGLPVTDRTTFVDDVEELIAYRNDLLARREDLEYEIDGVVGKVDDFEARTALGRTARHPKWAIAYKFPAKTGETTVDRIVVQVGRTGKLTPVALLSPVDVRGVTISRATLHNEAHAQELGISAGATVRIERAGDVIPEVVAVTEAAEGRFEMPGSCPACGGDVVREGEYHYCPNELGCPAQVSRSVQHFCSPGAMDIEGVGSEAATALVESGLVETVADLYDLSEEELTSLEGFGETSARRLVAELESSKEVDLASFIFALGIRHVGTERARELAAAFSLSELREADEDALRTVPDIGPEVAASIASFFSDDHNGAVIDRLLAAGVSPTRAGRADELAGVTVVFTGSYPGYTRAELTDLLERHGANVTGSVSSTTDVLVVGENPGETKVAAAREHGVEELSPDQFRETVLDRLPDSELPEE